MAERYSEEREEGERYEEGWWGGARTETSAGEGGGREVGSREKGWKAGERERWGGSCGEWKEEEEEGVVAEQQQWGAWRLAVHLEAEAGERVGEEVRRWDGVQESRAGAKGGRVVCA